MFGNLNSGDYEYYRRNENADGNTWGTAMDICDVYVPNSTNSSMLFNTNNSVNTSGQFSLNSTKAIVYPNAIQDLNKKLNLVIYPNPTQNIVYLEFDNRDNVSHSTILLWDIQGNKLLKATQNLNSGLNRILLNTQAFASGTYFVQLNLEGMVFNRKFELRR